MHYRKKISILNSIGFGPKYFEFLSNFKDNLVFMISKNLPIEADCTQTKRKSWTEQSNENFI